MSQPTISALERGHGANTSVEVWSVMAAAVGVQFAAYLERVPGADRPRDFEHLRRQQLVIDIASRGGWVARLEQPLDSDRIHSRSIDVVLTRPAQCEAVVVEVWDWFDDVGAAVRSLDAKVAELSRQLGAVRHAAAGSWQTSGLWVVRDTGRNRGLVTTFASIFVSRFPAAGHDWIAALTDADRPMPEQSGFLWTDPKAERLVPPRRVVRNGPTD